MRVVLFTLNGSWSHTSLALRCLRGPLEKNGFDIRAAVAADRGERDQ